jgi:2-polyprenyl-3-methyl-5-hydroxy-6-metoxy-1,4-benzoquinol methylase
MSPGHASSVDSGHLKGTETMSSFDEVAIETVQAFWDARPCNIRHSPRPPGTREYFDEVEQRKYFVEPHIPGFAEFARWKGKRVLEIGCGIGTDTMNFARAGARVTAVDLSPRSLEVARQRAEVFGLADRIQFHLGNAERLDELVPVEHYDLVYSFGVIHHTPHPEEAVSRIRKFMSADSELRIMVYSKVSYKLFATMRESGMWDMGRMDELMAKYSEAQTGCPVTYTYTFDEVRALLEGFTVEEVRKAHIFTWDVDAYKQYEYRKDPAWAGVDDVRLGALERELGWHTLVRARPIA